MYNLLEYSDNYSESLWNYHRDIPPLVVGGGYFSRFLINWGIIIKQPWRKSKKYP